MNLASDFLTYGSTSRITSKARNKGLIYGVHSRTYLSFKKAEFQIYGKVEPKNIESLFEIIVSELKRLLNGQITTADFKSLKRQRFGWYYRREVTTSSLTSHYSSSYSMMDKIEDYYATTEAIPTITKIELVDTFKSMFADRHYYLGLLGENPKQHEKVLYKKISSIFKA